MSPQNLLQRTYVTAKGSQQNNSTTYSAVNNNSLYLCLSISVSLSLLPVCLCSLLPFTMSLLSLSNELLIYISQFLDYADDFSAFSRTCLRLYSLVNPLLFPHYAIQHQCDALIYAMNNGDYILMERLIQARVNLFTYEEMTHHALLPTAARNGHLGMVQVLLDLTQEDIH